MHVHPTVANILADRRKRLDVQLIWLASAVALLPCLNFFWYRLLPYTGRASFGMASPDRIRVGMLIDGNFMISGVALLILAMAYLFSSLRSDPLLRGHAQLSLIVVLIVGGMFSFVPSNGVDGTDYIALRVTAYYASVSILPMAIGCIIPIHRVAALVLLCVPLVVQAFCTPFSRYEPAIWLIRDIGLITFYASAILLLVCTRNGDRNQVTRENMTVTPQMSSSNRLTQTSPSIRESAHP